MAPLKIYYFGVKGMYIDLDIDQYRIFQRCINLWITLKFFYPHHYHRKRLLAMCFSPSSCLRL